VTWHRYVWGILIALGLYGAKFSHQEWLKGEKARVIAITAMLYLAFIAFLAIVLWVTIGLP
jgi:hypothetical protein